MIVDFKVFDVGIQKALYVNTFSCDWFGKSIIGKKKKQKKKQQQQQTTNNENKKQKFPFQTKERKKNPHKFDDPLKHLVSYGSDF